MSQVELLLSNQAMCAVFRVLGYRSSQATLEEIAKTLKVTPNSVNKTLSHLRELNLIKSTPSKTWAILDQKLFLTIDREIQRREIEKSLGCLKIDAAGRIQWLDDAYQMILHAKKDLAARENI